MDQPLVLSSQQQKQLGSRRSRAPRQVVVAARSRSSRDDTAGARAGAGVAIEAQWRSVLGPESRLPNVYWGAMSPSSLRRMSYYTALPPEDQVLLEGEASYRYVRQGTALWSALHAGRLTTSRLKDALGLRDPSAARIVGGPQYPEMGVLHAYNHLLQPLYKPTTAMPHNAEEVNGGRQRSCSETEALRLNEAARLQCNEEMAAALGAAAADGPYNTNIPVASREADEGRRRDRGGLHDLRRDGGGDADDEAGWSRADRRRVSELAALAVGSAGSVRMRLLWGSLQESSAVATLAAMFPTSQLEEAGLLCLTDPARWGGEQRELPLIGASPDALITHHVPITRADVQAARAELRAVTAAAPGHPSDGHPGATQLRNAARRVARSVLRAALIRHTTTATTPPTTPSTAMTTTTLHAAAGGAGIGPPAMAGGDMPPAAVDCVGSLGPPPLFSEGCEEAVEWLSGELLRQRADGDVDVMGVREGGGGDGEVVAVVRLREVVEVKNHCPFVYKGQRKARKRGIVLEYVVRDRGPIESIWPLWVPQLQAHMACSGADSALLLSRSPSRGVRVFRMFRDDAYLSAAFDVLRELQTAHVAPRQPPGSDPWVGRSGYDELLQRTLAIARDSVTVVSTCSTPQLSGTDPSAFWDVSK